MKRLLVLLTLWPLLSFGQQTQVFPLLAFKGSDWTPLSEPGLHVWYKADAQIYSSTNDAVAFPVEDSSGNNHDLIDSDDTPSTPQVRIRTNRVNNLPFIHWVDGHTEVTTLVTNVLPGVTTVNGWTIGVVGPVTPNDVFTGLAWYSPQGISTTNLNLAYVLTGTNVIYYFTGKGSSTTVTNGTYCFPVITAQWSSADSIPSISDGVNTVTGSAGSGGAVSIDASVIQSSWSSQMAELLVYTNKLSASSLANLRNYLQSRWSAGCPTNSLNVGLVSSWDLDSADISDLWLDQGPAMQRLASSINPPSVGTGILNNAASFASASSEMLTHVDSAELSVGNIDFTFGFYFNADTLPAQSMFITKTAGTAATTEYLIRHYSNTNLDFTIANGGTYYSCTMSNLTLNTGQWYGVMAWYDATADTMNLQLDNGTPQTFSNSTGSQNTTSVFRLGAYDGSTIYYNGRLDEVRFWKRVLTSAERTLWFSSSPKVCCPYTQ